MDWKTSLRMQIILQCIYEPAVCVKIVIAWTADDVHSDGTSRGRISAMDKIYTERFFRYPSVFLGNIEINGRQDWWLIGYLDVLFRDVIVVFRLRVTSRLILQACASYQSLIGGELCNLHRGSVQVAHSCFVEKKITRCLGFERASQRNERARHSKTFAAFSLPLQVRVRLWLNYATENSRK